jgi:hypothetical protein
MQVIRDLFTELNALLPDTFFHLGGQQAPLYWGCDARCLSLQGGWGPGV